MAAGSQLQHSRHLTKVRPNKEAFLMTRRTTLCLICAFEVALLLSVAAWSALADNENSNNWFIEGRYQASLYEGNGWKENEVDLGGASSNIITATSEKRNKLNSSGIAIGRTFLDKKVGISLTYEKFASSTWSSGNFASRDGRTFDYARHPIRMHHFMLETS